MTNREVCSPFDYIHDDLLLNCLARVSRLYYPILSLVSKRFRSLVTSLGLYQIRALLGRTDNCLYVRLRFSSETLPRWFTLCRRPTRIPTPTPNPNPNSRWFTSCFCFNSHRTLTNHTMKEEKKSTDENILVSIPNEKYSPLRVVTYTRIGSVNMVSSYINGAFLSRNFVCMNGRSKTWYDAPNMLVARNRSFTSVLDGKLYVVECCEDSHSSNMMEIFDPKTQIWEHVPCPSAEILGRTITNMFSLDGKLYLIGDKRVVYKPNENKWDVVEWDTFLMLVSHYYSCVIGNVCYSVFSRTILWYDSESRWWRILKGLKKLPRLPKRPTFVRLVDYGGKMALLWEEKTSAMGSNKKTIWCAVIALERRNAIKMYGKIEWCGVVLTVPNSSSLLDFVSLNI